MLTSGGRRPQRAVILALVLFGLACSFLIATIPRLFIRPVQPNFLLFLVAGVAVIALTAGLFGFLDRLGMGFGRTVLVLAAGYNALIAAVKLGLAPAALYRANSVEPFDASMQNPNSLTYYLAVAFGVLLLYVLVFGVMYRLFRRRFRRRSLSSEAPRARRVSGRVLVAILVAVVVIAVSLLWVAPLLYVGLPTLSYLVYIFSTFGVAITLALALAAFLAYRTFDEVEKQAAHLGDATLLATFFWLGLALIVLYHVMWVVFLLTLVSIWPFQTYTPK
jgi:heme/copper-type cytochrome/quinol oxidase subunit 2